MTVKDMIAQVREYRDRKFTAEEIAHRLGMHVYQVLVILKNS